MKIYTKTGDQGETSLLGGSRVLKSDLQIESFGTVDELNSYIGLIRDQFQDQKGIDFLIEIQDRLFTLGSHLANDGKKDKIKIPPILDIDIEKLEVAIDEMETTLPPMHAFILPGGNTTVSFIHIARCICRRAERSVVRLNQLDNNVKPIIVQYLNRLSDYLFVLSRYKSQELKANEIEWKPKY